jgi:hypothetical protein
MVVPVLLLLNAFLTNAVEIMTGTITMLPALAPANLATKTRATAMIAMLMPTLAKQNTLLNIVETTVLIMIVMGLREKTQSGIA